MENDIFTTETQRTRRSFSVCREIPTNRKTLSWNRGRNNAFTV